MVDAQSVRHNVPALGRGGGGRLGSKVLPSTSKHFASNFELIDKLNDPRVSSRSLLFHHLQEENPAQVHHHQQEASEPPGPHVGRGVVQHLLVGLERKERSLIALHSHLLENNSQHEPGDEDNCEHPSRGRVRRPPV